MLQIVAAADPGQLKVWENDDTGVAIADGSEAARLTGICSSWWSPREPRLLYQPLPAEFDVEVRAGSVPFFRRCCKSMRIIAALLVQYLLRG